MYKSEGDIMQNPFTTTFSKIPDNTYISTEQLDEIIGNFTYDNPSESVYKITGVRGSGKTVLLAKIEDEMRTEEFERKGWLVCSLSPARDMLQQFVAFLRKTDIVKEKKDSRSVSISASVNGLGGGIGVSSSDSDKFFDVGIEIGEILSRALKLGKKIFIGVDDVSKTKDMIIFAAEFGKWLIERYPIYMVCTGLYENIEQLSNVSNLTFFRRATTIMTRPLSYMRMTEMYRRRLGVDSLVAKEMAEMTRGYAYAFQELGVLAFRNRYDSPQDAEGDLKAELYAYAYEKIWEEMSDGDRELARLLIDKDEYKREDVLSRMSKPKNFSVYRDRLIRRGILSVRQGYLGLALPYFGEYIRDYWG